MDLNVVINVGWIFDSCKLGQASDVVQIYNPNFTSNFTVTIDV